MKRFIVLLWSLALVFTLAACGGDGGGKSPSESPVPAESGEKQSMQRRI